MDGIGRGKTSGFENINPLVDELRKSFPSPLLVYQFLDEVISSPFRSSPDTNNTSGLPDALQPLCDGDDVPHYNELFAPPPSSTLSLSDILIPFPMRENLEQDDGHPLCLQEQKLLPTSLSSVQPSSGVSNAYDILLNQLKRPESAGIVKSLQSFEREFRSRSRLPEATGTALGKALQELISRTMSQLRLLMTPPPFSESDVWWCVLEKALEAMVVHKVHDVAWGLVVDHEGDTFLSSRLRSLSFLSFEHFDMRALEENSTKWALAESKLCDMDSMRTPCGKLACLKECLQLMSEVLEKNSPVEPPCLPGADDFLPALILLVISASPPRLASNVEFLQCFHNPADLHKGEEGYMMTLLVSSIHFLKNADASTLSIRPEDFEKCIEESMRGKQQDVALERRTTSEIEKDEGKQGGIELLDSKEELFTEAKRVKPTDRIMPLERVPELPLPHLEELKASQVRLLKPVPSSSSRDWTVQEQPLYHHHSHQQESIFERLIFADKTLCELHPSDLPALLEEHHCLVRLCSELLAEKELLLR